MADAPATIQPVPLECRDCYGSGKVAQSSWHHGDVGQSHRTVTCPECKGRGVHTVCATCEEPAPLAYNRGLPRCVHCSEAGPGLARTSVPPPSSKATESGRGA